MLVRDSHVDLQTPTGPMRTYVYEPTGGEERRRPGLVLYSEIFQQTEPIRRLAVRFASEGFLVAVPEIYHENLPPGTVLGYDDAGKDKGNALKYETPLSSHDGDARTALDFLKSHPRCSGRLGVVGFCIGGHLSFRAALQPDVSSSACCYPTDLHNSGTLGQGKNDETLKRAGEIRGEMLLIWGRQDPHIPHEGRRKVYDAIDGSGLRFEWHEFNGEHAFMRDEGSRYNAQVARQAFVLAADFFKRTLI